MKILKYFSFTLFLASCGITMTDVNNGVNKVNEIAGTNTGESTSNPLTNDEVIAGLKEALTVGIDSVVSQVSVSGGFNNNNLIRILLPESANNLKEQAVKWGMENQVNKVENTMNQAAEIASAEAKDVFVNAIKNMSVQDGFAILNGGENAATEYLKSATGQELMTKFQPIIHNALEQVQLTKYWTPVVSKYNQFAKLRGQAQVEEDLEEYVMDKAMNVMFSELAKKEKEIRKDPVAQVTDILKRVFGKS